MATVYGYARVSTDDQTIDSQMRDLKAAGCDPIITESGSGVLTNPRLARLLVRLEAGDSLVVWKLDRLGRSTKDLIEKLDSLRARNVEFRSLRDSIDTTSASGKLLFHILAAFAEFEREVIRERTRAGLTAARARGRVFGRPGKLTQEQKAHVRQLLASGSHKPGDVARLFNVDRATIYRAVRA